MLTLIGLGLFDENDLTLRGIRETKNADKVYIELYTSKWHGNLKNLEKIIGKEIIELKRKDLEENSNQILELATNQSVVIFVQGDPLIQTTHVALLEEARKKKIETRVVHNASIISAIAETGLHVNKFGPFVTIPLPEKTKGKLPESVYDTIRMNKQRGLHTLCLLDVIAEEDKYMTANEAMKILLDIENKRKEGIFTEQNEIIIFTKVGSEDSSIVYGKIGDLIKKDFKITPAILIILGLLHFTEKEFLENF